MSGSPLLQSAHSAGSQEATSTLKQAWSGTPKSTLPALRSTRTLTPHDLRAPRAHGVEHVADAAACREDVVDDENAVAGPELETALELAAAPISALGDEGGEAEVAGRVEGEDHASGRRSRNERRVRLAEVLGDLRAELGGDVRPLEDAELLDVDVGVAAARELEVPAQDGPTRLELGAEIAAHAAERSGAPRPPSRLRYGAAGACSAASMCIAVTIGRPFATETSAPPFGAKPKLPRGQ